MVEDVQGGGEVHLSCPVAKQLPPINMTQEGHKSAHLPALIIRNQGHIAPGLHYMRLLKCSTCQGQGNKACGVQARGAMQNQLAKVACNAVDTGLLIQGC